MMAATSKADSLRFLTLTVRSNEKPLAEQLDDLYGWYRELRRRKAWKRHVRGAIATVEITRNEETGEWHPHLHVICDGEFWHQRDISIEWGEVTGGSTIVDIRRINKRSSVARYIAKYASKPANMDGWPPEAICEYAAGVHRRRMLITSGRMHNVPIDGDIESSRGTVSGSRIPLGAIERRSNAGCIRAQALLRQLAEQSSAYQQSLASRSPRQAPTLALDRKAMLVTAAELWRDLHQLWSDDPASFVMGGDGDWVVRKAPPKPPGAGKLKDHTDELYPRDESPRYML